MASKQPLPTPRYCIQPSTFTKQDGWQLWDISVHLSGNIAVSRINDNTHQTSIEVYSVRNSNYRDKPKIFYSKQFEKYVVEDGSRYWNQYVSFVDHTGDNVLLTCLCDKLEVIDLIQDRVLKSRKITLINHGGISCLSVREREIFIGFHQSNQITVYDVIDLNEIKSIILQGIQDVYWPYDMTAIADRIFVCVVDGKEVSNQRSLIFEEKNGRILSELTKPTDTVHWCAQSITVCVTLNVIACAWSQTYVYGGMQKGIGVIVFYSRLSENNSSFLIVEVEFGIGVIRISDRGDRMVTRNRVTEELKTYDMAELFTYHHLKESLTSHLQADDCVMLINYFTLPEDQSDAILKSETPTENLLLVLEERGYIQPSSVDRLLAAFNELNINSSCHHLLDFYKKTRMQATSYDRFLATLSAHVTASLPRVLCHYFSISDEKKSSITSSQNPGLSLLLVLDEIGIIKPSDVGTLEQPFSDFRLVQAVAKIHEYHAIVEEEKNQLVQQEVDMKAERKREFFIQCLQRRIKSWYETMTPVPWRKSCRWKSTDLFVSSGLILTDSKSKRSLVDIDEECKLDYTQIFTHERLKSEARIILEGDPGAGKTMLMSQLAYDWSQGKLSEIKILILLPLKFFQERTLVEAIKDFYVPEDKNLSINDIENFLQEEEKPTHLLLDGLEEYSGRLTQEKSEIGEIMSKVKYASCKVLLSSRSDFAKDLPKGPMLKLGRFGETERSSYIERIFPKDSRRQMETKQVIADSPIIQDLCSVPLLFVLAVHNVENMRKAQMGQLDRMTPFVEGIVDILCPLTSLITRTQELHLRDQVQKQISVEELAFNGLCKGSQQLYWQKEFVDEKIETSKEWIDSGVLVVEEMSSSMPMDKKDQQLESAAVESGEVTGWQSNAEVQLSKRVGEDSEKGPDAEIRSVDDGKQNVTTQLSGSNAKHIPLQVRFLHKIIQEWFAAKYFSSMISKVRLDLQEKYLFKHLSLIHPADLHHVLRFTCAMCPPSCHIIIKHLFGHRTKEGDVPDFIMNCIFLCLAEYTGEHNSNTLKVLSEVCKEDIIIHFEDSRLLQQAKVTLLEVASSHGIRICKLLLADLVVSAREDVLQFNSGVLLIVLDTLEIIEISRWDQTLKEKDYSNILQFIAKSSLLRKASLNFPDQPPKMDNETAISLQKDDKTVTWIIGSKLSLVPDPTQGKWVMNMKGHQKRMTVSSSAKSYSGVPPWHHQTIQLDAKAVMSRGGGELEIPNTGIKLYVPPNAFQDEIDQCQLQLRIILPGTCDEPVTSFTSNTSSVVELLPNNLRLKQAVSLTLPHCLELEEDCGDGNYTAKIFMSHHENGAPFWEEKPNWLYYLDDIKCIIWLESFCWVKYEINGAIVEGKKIQVYTAGEPFVPGNNRVQTEVGFFPDLPGGGEILQKNKSLTLSQQKPFKFRKKSELPLTLSLLKIKPTSWKPIFEQSQEISFQSIADDEEKSCPFIFENENQVPSLTPVLIFWISQGDRGIKLTLCPRVEDKGPSTQSEEICPALEESLQDCFMFLKGKLAEKWKDLGRRLRLSDDEISLVNCKDIGDVEECTYQMLKKWHQKNGRQATRAKLVEALEKLGRKDLAEDLPSL